MYNPEWNRGRMDRTRSVWSGGFNRHDLWAIFLIPIVFFSFTACGEKRSQQKSSRYGGTLYIGVETPFHGFDILGVASGGILLPAMAIINNGLQEPKG